ncbi:MAG: arsenic efflux protein [Clostridia bacterium]|nr:arsenic efflux protein [Clostridia bacterium]
MNFLLHTEGHSHTEEVSHGHGVLVEKIEHFLLEHWGGFGEFLAEVVLHAIVETLGIVVFLFLTYLLLEFIEHKAKDKTERLMRRAGAFGPAIGGLLGAAPQCGFSTVAANLYTSGVVTLGTLIAVFLSTSDEMLMIFINHAEDVKLSSILLILGYKVLCGLAVGFAVDFVIRIVRKKRGTVPHRKHPIGCTCSEHRVERAAKAHRHTDEHHHSEYGHAEAEHNAEEGECHGHEEAHGFGALVKCALGHTLSVGLFVFLITLALNALMHYVGEDMLGKILVDIPVVSHLIAGLVGLIPNCAVSVALCELALNGLISEGVMLAGLFSGAGVGLLVLIRTNSDPWEDFYVPAILVAAGVLFGTLADLLPFINIF